MSIEAMKQALEALANAIEVIPRAGYTAGMQRQAAEALRQAIADAEKQEAVAWMWKDGTLTSDPDFADGTWTPLFAAPVHASDTSQEPVDELEKFAELVRADERKAVLEAVEALTGMEADRHKMFSEGYDHALYHIRQLVEGRSKK